MICHLALPAALGVLCAAGTATAAPAIAFFPGSGVPSAEADAGEWQSPVLIVYDAPYCELEMAMECQLVRLDCDGPDLQISVDGFGKREFAEAARSLKLTGLSAEAEPMPNQVERSALDGTWSAIFVAPYTQDPGLVLDDRLTTLAFETGD